MQVDLLIIGGGINGCAIAADAAGRGLSVVLCEKDDLAFATSSASSKLIHGGLRYLSQYDFKLVRESLKEQEILLKRAPFLVWPLEFILPHTPGMRAKPMISLGLFLYDHLYSSRSLPRSKRVNLQKQAVGEALKGSYRTGYRYFDCATDDARLVIINALSARENGAHILTRTVCEKLQRHREHWSVTLHDTLRDQRILLNAKAVVNATGPWASKTLNQLTGIYSNYRIKQVLGSHIVVHKLYEGSHAYNLQNPDGRTVFTIPYKKTFTLIGTTEVEYEGDPDSAEISESEISYLSEVVHRFFNKKINREEIVWSYAGVRPLVDNHAESLSSVSRDFVLELNADESFAPILSVYGGKLTTHRILAEHAVDKLEAFFPEMKKAWTSTAKLPGADFSQNNFQGFMREIEKEYDWLPAHILSRYVKLYGSLSYALLNDCRSLNDMGEYFSAGLYERELIYLVKNEWAKSVDDILWRRTKLGLYLSPEQREHLEQYL